MKLNVQKKQTCENLEISSGFIFVLNKYTLFIYTSMRAYLLNRPVLSVFATPTECSLPWDSSGKNTEWIAMPYSRDLPRCRDQTQVSCIAGRFLTVWVTRRVDP